MSEIRVNKLIDEGGTGAPILTYGCEVPVGYGITGAGGVNVSGICTASGGFVGNVTGNASGLTGTPDITVRNITGVAATFSGVVTYEDVTNVDSVGIITARTGIKVLAGGANVVGVVTATAGVRIGAGESIGSDGAAVVYYGDGSQLTGVSGGLNAVNFVLSI